VPGSIRLRPTQFGDELDARSGQLRAASGEAGIRAALTIVRHFEPRPQGRSVYVSESVDSL
jgi:hypothetical protein